MNLHYFNELPFIQALKKFFAELHVPVNYIDENPAGAKDLLGDKFNPNNTAHQLIGDVYLLGIVDDSAFTASPKLLNFNNLSADYDGILIFGVEIGHNSPTRTQLAEISRVLNRVFPYTPVTVIFKYGNQIAFANSERTKYQQQWREGEKVGKVTMLKDIHIVKTHAAHVRILAGLTIDKNKIGSFSKLYKYWHSVFSLQALNDQFYADLQAWFYYSAQKIKLPFRPDYINEKENIKNFLVRLLARTLFCWFVKEKGLIKPELLELKDWDGNNYNLTNDIDNKDFLQHNSYYRGILQNIFYNALNQKEKRSEKDFKWLKYLHPDFDFEWLVRIPYLNGGIFDKLEEDNAKESIEDSVVSIPNYLFYGIETEEKTTKGKGPKTTTLVEKVEHKGLNGILKSYKFTLDENTPFEEDIALDPEMLGLVFENLLAELDPNLEENTIKSIRKLTGSYYTPRKIIYEMVNDSLYLYLLKFLQNNYPKLQGVKKSVSDLVYFDLVNEQGPSFCHAIVHGLDKFRMLDPACGSGAFPMGMLHRMVDILKLVDPANDLWIDLKVKAVDAANRSDFKKILSLHLDDYSRKLGIIRDSIYGIDIQPLAVQITKLRFFISLLIDQKTDKGITPMPNIETKIICADSLKNIQADLFSSDAIEQLTDARSRYYQPDISHNERETIANEIVIILDGAFPTFAFQITGKRIPGQNKALIKEWFKHSTIAAPFFNMVFFFPELNVYGGFDCVIGNPPYGGFKISDEVRLALGVESKDPYGAFIARFLNTADKPTPLKHGGVLSFIVSDTFMTIKSHLPLRRMLMQNCVHKMLRMHPDTFRATVNTVIMVAERNTQNTQDEKQVCLMADLTNISIHDNYDHLIEVLSKTKGVGFERTDNLQCTANEEYAIYYYPQNLIRTYSNLPFFVAIPKLFALMNDGNENENTIKNYIKSFDNKEIKVTEILFDNKKIIKTKLGDEYERIGKNKKWKNIGIAKIISGIKTGANQKYLYSENGIKYPQTDISKVVNFEMSTNMSDDEKQNGINATQCLLAFDMGQSSEVEEGWLPNYYQVPTKYFIDWSRTSVDSMKSELHSDLANWEFRCIKCIVYSKVGQYSPTFRLSTASIIESNCNGIFSSFYTIETLLGILCSKFVKYMCNVFINHTIASQVDDLKEIVIVINDKIEEVINYSKIIIQSQKINPRYDYASHEQIEIDRLVYEAYGLNAEDVLEVENWYARRYPKLSAAQKSNLRALGKNDDYLKLYGLK